MGHRWENVTGDMGVNILTDEGGLELTIFYKDRSKDKDLGLFLLNSEDVYPLSKKQMVHMKYEADKKYAYLLKKTSGNLGELLDDAEFRLSAPACIPHNNFTRITNIILEHKVKAPDWEDITAECKPVLMKSTSSNGYYIRLIHGSKPVALFGVHPNGYVMAERGNRDYKVTAADCATISFRVFKRNK